MPDEILTVREVAEFLKVIERTIYRLASDGEIPSLKVGGSWRFLRSDLVAWMAKQIDRDPGDISGAGSKGGMNDAGPCAARRIPR